MKDHGGRKQQALRQVIALHAGRNHGSEAAAAAAAASAAGTGSSAAAVATAAASAAGALELLSQCATLLVH